MAFGGEDRLCFPTKDGEENPHDFSEKAPIFENPKIPRFRRRLPTRAVFFGNLFLQE